MQLRNRNVASGPVLATNFNAADAFRRIQEEQEAREARDDDEDGLSDTETLTSHFCRLATIAGAAFGIGKKRPRANTTLQPSQPVTSLPPAPHPTSSPPAPSGSSPPSVDNGCTPPKQSRQNKRRKVERKEQKAKGVAKEQGPTPAKLERLVKECEEVNGSIKTSTLPATSCGYWAKSRTDTARPKQENLKKLRKEGYTLMEWDGKTPRAITEAEKKVLVMLAGQPDDATFTTACNDLFTLIMEKGAELDFIPKHLEHVRGNFPAINVGVTHGKGSKTPHTLDHSKKVAEVVYSIVEDKNMIRVAQFQNCAFKTWAPKLYAFYEKYMEKLWAPGEWKEKADVTLRRNFEKSVFPCIAINFGPRVWALRHRDTKNLPFGWCAITALGNFDPTKGGHLVLPELRLIIEFPPGATILIPSATLTHANIPVRSTESRVSFTQFCAGDIFRFIDCDFKTETELAAKDPKKFAEVQKLKKTRWMTGIKLFSTIDELGSVFKKDENVTTTA